MKIKRCNILATLTLLACLSCSTDKDTAFTRMERLFADDSVKQGIAEYYNQFAPYHHGVSRTLVDSLGQPADINYETFPTDTAFREYLELNSYKYVEGPSLPDEVAMTDGALERRINAMAEVRQMPWCRKIGWEEFCRYVLPYRNGDEALSEWYLTFRDKYLHTIPDSVTDTSSIREVTRYLMRCLKREVEYGTRSGYQEFFNMRVCQNRHILFFCLTLSGL